MIRTLKSDQLSADQRIAFHLLHAQVARLTNDQALTGQQITAAGKAAADSHGALALRVRLERVREALTENDVVQAASLLATSWRSAASRRFTPVSPTPTW